MKKILLAIMVAMPVIVLAQDAAYTVQGKVGNLSAPAKMYLEYQIKDKVIKDSVVLNNGQFQFKGTVDEAPVFAYLVLNEKGDGIKFKDYKPSILKTER